MKFMKSSSECLKKFVKNFCEDLKMFIRIHNNLI